MTPAERIADQIDRERAAMAARKHRAALGLVPAPSRRDRDIHAGRISALWYALMVVNAAGDGPPVYPPDSDAD